MYLAIESFNIVFTIMFTANPKEFLTYQVIL